MRKRPASLNCTRGVVASPWSVSRALKCLAGAWTLVCWVCGHRHVLSAILRRLLPFLPAWSGGVRCVQPRDY